MAKSKRERQAERREQLEREANTRRIAMELGRPVTKAGLARFYGISAREVARRIDDDRCVKCDQRPRGFDGGRGVSGWDATWVCQTCQGPEGITKKLKSMKADWSQYRTTTIFHQTPHALAMAKREARSYRQRRPRKRTRVRGFIGVKYYVSPADGQPLGVYRIIEDAVGLEPQSWGRRGAWQSDTNVWYKVVSGGDVRNSTRDEAEAIIRSWGYEPVDMDFPPPEPESASTP